MFEKLTNRAKQSIKLGKKEAQRLNHNYLGTEHLLLGLFKLGQGIAVNILRNQKLDYDTVFAEIERIVGYGPELQVFGDPALSAKVKRVFDIAHEEAGNLNHNYIGTEHLFLGLIKEPDSVAYQCLENMGIDINEVRREILKELETFNLQLPPMNMGGMPPIKPMEKPGVTDKTPALKAYGHDLNEMFREGKLDPVIGRKEEIERLIQILCRRRKNNPVLIGEPGVGKTAIVEGLAQKICKGEVPDLLSKKIVITLDLPLMISGTKYRGQFEERIKAVMDEVKKHGNILLFIDELHTIVGAGAAEGAIDASNILKPALSRGEIQCIGATTTDEFRKHILTDGALERRFQSIPVGPPSITDSVLLLHGLKPKYEAHHHCTYTDEAIRYAVEGSERFIPGRFLPDKAIDLMDEAGSRARIALMHMPQDLVLLEDKIEKLKNEKDAAINSQDYENAAALRDQEKKERERLDQLRLEWEEEKDKIRAIVDHEDIAAVISKQTGIPLTKLTEAETQKVLQMEQTLKETIIGQDDAISSVCRAIRRSKADMKDPKRPIGVFMFLGPTGVGKTLLAKQIAATMFGGEEALIQVDMSEYMEKFAVSRMTGSPPGYVGHDEGGQLTEQVRRRPYSVVLFDEVEKAHPDVMNIMLQIFEEGRLTDSFGRKVDFRNTIVILTSNLGADKIAKSTTMGFSSNNESLDYTAIKGKLKKEAEKGFKPEFLNRLDDVIIFRPLEKPSLQRVIEIEINKVTERLLKKNIVLTLDQTAKDLLVEKGFQPELGARPLRRIIEQYLQDPLAEQILMRPSAGGHWSVTANKEELAFTSEEGSKESLEKNLV